MTHKATLICGAAILAMVAASGAHAGRTLSKQHQAAIAKKQANFVKTQQPRTMKESEATRSLVRSGGTMVAVPEILFNQLYVVKDAKGNLVVREADASVDAGSLQQEEAAHE